MPPAFVPEYEELELFMLLGNPPVLSEPDAEPELELFVPDVPPILFAVPLAFVEDPALPFPATLVAPVEPAEEPLAPPAPALPPAAEPPPAA